MASALAHKAWTDLSRRPVRAVLTTLTLSLAVASFGILAVPSLMNRAMTTEIAAARLYDVAIPIDDAVLSSAQMHGLASLPNVSRVSARSLFTTTTLVGTQRVSTEVWGVPDFNDQPIDRVITNSRPGANQVVVDTQDAQRGISNAGPGDTLRIEVAGGSFRSVPVVGSARAIALNQDTQTDHLVLYATQGTVDQLGGIRGVNYLEFHIRHVSPSAAAATVTAIRTFLGAQPTKVLFSNLPIVRAPGDWPGRSIFDQRVRILDILIVLAILSAAFLLANTIRTMIAEQKREIGVIRAVGAGRRDVHGLYMRTATLLGACGAILGMAVGIGLAQVLVSLFARLFWGVSPAFAVDWPVALGSALVGLALTVLIGELTVGRALRTPVRDALEDEGLVSSFGGSRFDRALTHLRTLPAPLLIGIRNAGCQKGRSLSTIVQIALAVATLLGLLSLALAVSEVTDQSWNVLDYDISLFAQPGGHLYDAAVAGFLRTEPGVSGVEEADYLQMTYRGQTLYGLGVHARTFIREPIVAGHWLTSQEQRSAARVIVVGSAAARLWDLHPGSRVTLTTSGGPETFRVIGVGGSQANNGFNIYTSLGVLQQATGHPGLANAMLIRAVAKSHASINALTTRLQNALARSGYLSSTQIMYAGRANDQAQARTTLLIVECMGLFIVAISMLGLINAITMSIIERTREIGVLRCLGARARDLRRIFRTETISLATIGFVIAVPLGWALAHALRWLVLHLANAQLPVPYTFRNLLVALVGTWVLAVLTVAVPLRRVARLRPGDAIRYS